MPSAPVGQRRQLLLDIFEFTAHGARQSIGRG